MKIMLWALSMMFCVALVVLSYYILGCWIGGGVIMWSGCWGVGVV